MTTMKELEARLDGLERRLDDLEGRGGAEDGGVRFADDDARTAWLGLDADRATSLLERVERLEKVSALGSPAALTPEAEANEEARDQELLARNPTSYDEAVAQAQARERQARREADRQGDAEGAPEEDDSTDHRAE